MKVVRSRRSDLRESTLRDTAVASASLRRERKEFLSLVVQLPGEDRPRFQVYSLGGGRKLWEKADWLRNGETRRICCSSENTVGGVWTIKGKLENGHRELLYQLVRLSDQ